MSHILRLMVNPPGCKPKGQTWCSLPGVAQVGGVVERAPPPHVPLVHVRPVLEQELTRYQRALGERHRERERQRETQTQKESERDRDTHTHRDRQRETHTESQRERDRGRHRGRHRERGRELKSINHLNLIPHPWLLFSLFSHPRNSKV